MDRIVLNDRQLQQLVYYKTGKGPALLLVHGFPANVALWREVYQALAQNYTLLMPNFFEAPNSWIDAQQSVSMQQLAQAFHTILVHEQVDKVLYAGHSMGAYMGLAFAKLYPESLLGLSLLHGAPLPDDEERALGRKKTVSILEKGGKVLFLKKMVPALFAPEYTLKYPEQVQRQLDEAIAVEDKHLVAFYKAIMLREDQRTIAKNAPFPIQNIVGKKDSLANPLKEFDAENLSFINFVHLYDNIGHMAMLEAPKKLLHDWKHFFNYCLQRTNV